MALKMNWKPTCIAVPNNNNHVLTPSIPSKAINEGIILLKGLEYDALIEDVANVFDKLAMPQNQDLIADLNKAYSANLVFKDAKKTQLDASKIDQKRSLDLSPYRIAIINENDPTLLPSIGKELDSALIFFDTMCDAVVPLVMNAICKAAQIEVDAHKINFNYRMLDYYKSANVSDKKCGAHRDFGLFTLIFQDETGGLQVQRQDGKWYDVEADGQSVVCLFGWCAEILSNGRIKATKHRVIANKDGKKRNSAVLFVAPGCNETLKPLVVDGEECNYASIKVGELKERMRDAWKMREGTLSKTKFNAMKSKIMNQEEIVKNIVIL